MPLEDPPPLPTRNNPLGRDGNISRCCNTRMLGLAIIFVFSMRIWVDGILEYRKLEASRGAWIHTNATVVGINTTYTTVQGTYYNIEDSLTRTYYCPLLNYETITGENITVIRDTLDCFRLMNDAVELVGSEVHVRYDPNNPEEFVEQSDYENEMNLLILMITCGIVLSVVLGLTVIRIATTADRDGTTNDEGDQMTGLERKEREELIRSKFHFQKVSSVDHIINIQSTKPENVFEKKEEEEEEVEEVDEPTEIDEEVGDVGTRKGDDLSPSSPPRPVLPSLANRLGLNSTTLLLSSWRRPAGVVECSICLEEYQPGEIICTPKATECNHMFHDQCVTSWLMANHDDCPLCRVNLLKE